MEIQTTQTTQAIQADIIANLRIVNYRGKYTISTFPLELVWGVQGSVLECENCMAYGICPNTNILIGMCVNCANLVYHGKYGCGYYQHLKGFSPTDIPVAFGNLKTKDVVSKLKEIIENEHINSNLKQVINHNYYDYTVYNLSLLSTFDINLLKTANNEGWIQFKKYYNVEDEVLHMLINKIFEIKKDYQYIPTSELLFNKKYYKKCSIIEKFYKVKLSVANNINLQIPEDLPVFESVTIKYSCSFCKIEKLQESKKELKNCGCKEVNYCSFACQKRDWKYNHKYSCTYNSNIISNLGLGSRLGLNSFANLTVNDEDYSTESTNSTD